jgi:UDP-N-acetylmuramyl pentapeptide phosphotransferase/UDP-N-acetylglucosamine-1-phosphate transferase
MILLFMSIAISFILTLLLIRLQSSFSKYALDTHSGPQKVHTRPVSRIGGLAIFISVTLSILYRHYFEPDDSSFQELGISLIFCAIPAFIVGFLEDVTKRTGILIRMLGIIFSSALAFYVLSAQISDLGIPGTKALLMIPFFCLILTLFSITGLTNSYNLIDGFNGLASMVGILTLVSISYVSFKNSDSTILFLSVIMIGAIIGFFIWNYPNGLIFLGDAGAYFIGFYIAVLSILLVQRHPNISPFYALVVNAYPIFETLFTIWRRRVHRGRKSMMPDGIHFHTLIYRRVMRWATRDENMARLNNARTSPYLWALSCMSIVPATLWWENDSYLIISILGFCIFYILCYRWIVLFKKI